MLKILIDAEKKHRAGNIDGGWKLLHAAERQSLLAIAGQAELEAIAIQMGAEAGKLDSWRKEAVTQLLACDPNDDGLRMRLFHAAVIRDEHYANQAYKDGIRATAATWLATFVVIGLLALFALAKFGLLSALVDGPPYAAQSGLFGILVAIGVIGWLGAATSAIFTAATPAGPSRIPEMVYTFRTTLMRLLAGPLSAIFIYFVLMSDYLEQVVKSPVNGYGLVLILFVAGFTERLVRRAVEAIAGKPT